MYNLVRYGRDDQSDLMFAKKKKVLNEREKFAYGKKR